MGCGSSSTAEGGGGLSTFNSLLFPAPNCSSYGDWSFEGEIVWVSLARYGGRPGAPAKAAKEEDADLDKYTFPCRLIQGSPSARYLVMYFHRNADDLGSCRFFCEKLNESLGVHVLVVEFPGYGMSTACSPSGNQLKKHAFAALAFATEALGWPSENIISMGACIGVGPAVALAGGADIGGLVLIAPFLSIRKMVRNHVGPAAITVTEQFPNEALAPKIKSPTLIFHGEEDKMFPMKHTEQLYALLGCRKQLVKLDGVSHHTCLTKDEKHLLKPFTDFFDLPGTTEQKLSPPSWAFQRHQQTGVAAVAAKAPSGPERVEGGEFAVDIIQDPPLVADAEIEATGDTKKVTQIAI